MLFSFLDGKRVKDAKAIMDEGVTERTCASAAEAGRSFNVAYVKPFISV